MTVLAGAVIQASMQRDIVKALHELLAGRDEQARTARVGMQPHLIQVVESLLSRDEASAGENMLTTEQAAELMKCSRPYVAMLIDNKKLAGATATKSRGDYAPKPSP